VSRKSVVIRWSKDFGLFYDACEIAFAGGEEMGKLETRRQKVEKSERDYAESRAKECTIRSFLRARGDSGSRGRKSYSAKHLVGARGLVRLRPLVPGAGQFLDLSFWARARALDGSDARVLWKAPHR
jgi:hypothetical protein